jgi:hypothetical protein
MTYLLKLSDASGVWSEGRDTASFNFVERFWYQLFPNGKAWFGGYVIGFESLIVNAMIAIAGLGLIHVFQKRAAKS